MSLDYSDEPGFPATSTRVYRIRVSPRTRDRAVRAKLGWLGIRVQWLAPLWLRALQARGSLR